MAIPKFTLQQTVTVVKDSVEYEFLDDIMEASTRAPFDNMSIRISEKTIPVSPIHLD